MNEGVQKPVGLIRRRGSTDVEARSHGSAFALVFFLVLLLVLAALYAVGYFFTSDRVPRGASVANVSIGGLMPMTAKDKLEDELVPRSFDPLTATFDGTKYRIKPRAAGLSLDVPATVESAGGGRSLDPFQMVETFTGGDEVDPVVDVDDAQLERALDRLADKVRRAPVNGTVTFEQARPQPRFALPGRELDIDRARRELMAAYLSTDSSFELSVAQVQPEVRNRAVRTAMDEFAEPAMSGPVPVRVPGGTVRIGPGRIAPALSMRAVDGQLEPVLDADVLAERIGNRLQPLTREPVDATVVLANRRPQVQPGKSGFEVQPVDVAERLLPALGKTGSGRVVELEPTPTPPDFTTKDARQLGVDEVVSEFTTYFPHADYRNVNLSRAAELMNGTLLHPDDIFSLNDVVGERTAANGFTIGYIISDGILIEDFGGGVSQVATTTYNAAFFAGMKDVEHHPHSFYIDRYPMGREATVAWGALDLQFQNETPYGVLVEAWVVPSTPSTEGEMHVRMWSTEYWKIRAGLSDQYDFTKPDIRYDPSKACVRQFGYGGFEVDVFRYFIRGGERVKKEKDHVAYIAADTVRCKPRPKDKDDRGDGGKRDDGGGREDDRGQRGNRDR